MNESSARRTTPYTRTSDGISAETLWQNVIRDHCNVFLVLNGNYPGEGRRVDNNTCGQPVHQVLQDYQNYANGGNGWLRYFEFDPANDQINAYTYSPVTGGYETDASSQFTLDYDMVGGSPFQLLGSDTVASGGTASFTWSGLTDDTAHEWYAVVSDGVASTTGPTWSFTTGGSVPTYATIPVSAGTGEKPQSKAWEHAGSWWAVLPSSTLAQPGTWLWRQNADQTWTPDAAPVDRHGHEGRRQDRRRRRPRAPVRRVPRARLDRVLRCIGLVCPVGFAGIRDERLAARQRDRDHRHRLDGPHVAGDGSRRH